MKKAIVKTVIRGEKKGEVRFILQDVADRVIAQSTQTWISLAACSAFLWVHFREYTIVDDTTSEDIEVELINDIS